MSSWREWAACSVCPPSRSGVSTERWLTFCQFSANRTVLSNCHYQSSVTSDQVPSSAYVPASLTSRELRFQLQGNKVGAAGWWRVRSRYEPFLQASGERYHVEPHPEHLCGAYPYAYPPMPAMVPHHTYKDWSQIRYPPPPMPMEHPPPLPNSRLYHLVSLCPSFLQIPSRKEGQVRGWEPAVQVVSQRQGGCRCPGLAPGFSPWN